MCIFLVSVSAAEISTIQVTGDIQFFSLKERDAVRFDYLEGTHVIKLDNIDEDKVTITIFPNSNKNTGNNDDVLPSKASLRLGRDLVMLDLNKDRTRDLQLGIADIENGEVTFFIEKAEEITTSNISDNKQNTPPTSGFNSNVVWTVILAAIALALVLVLIFARKK